MPKATVRLASGAVVNIEGTAAEVKELLSLYGESSAGHEQSHKKPVSPQVKPKGSEQAQQEKLSISEIVRNIKDCDEATDIEKRILDTTSQVNRILLPLFQNDNGKMYHRDKGKVTHPLMCNQGVKSPCEISPPL